MRKVIYKDGKKTRFKPGHKGNPHGRPKKLKTKLKKEGLKESQIKDITTEMLNMNVSELKKIVTDPKSTAYELMIANAIKTAVSKGDITQVFGHILPRVFGQPKESKKLELESTGGVNIQVEG